MVGHNSSRNQGNGITMGERYSDHIDDTYYVADTVRGRRTAFLVMVLLLISSCICDSLIWITSTPLQF